MSLCLLYLHHYQFQLHLFLSTLVFSVLFVNLSAALFTFVPLSPTYPALLRVRECTLFTIGSKLIANIFFSFVWFHLSNPKLCIAARWRNAATSKHFGPSPLIFLCVFRCIINYRMLKLERAKFRHLKIKLAFLSYLSQAGNDNKGHLNYTLQHWQMRIGGKERPGGCKEKAE